MKHKRYMVLLVDRKRAKLLTVEDGLINNKEELVTEHVPQKVKHGENTWDAQNKIFRHIEDHLHRHLRLVGNHALSFAKGQKIAGIIIGSHKSLFSKIESHIPYPLSRKIKGRFLIHKNDALNTTLKKVKRIIDNEN